MYVSVCVFVCLLRCSNERGCINKGIAILFAVGLATDIVPVTHICHNSNPSMNNEIENSFSGTQCYAESSAIRRENPSSKRQSVFTTLHDLILNMTSFTINNAVKTDVVDRAS